MQDARKIKTARLDPVPDLAPGVRSGRLCVVATLEDGTEAGLFSYYADELSFRPAEFEGRTVHEALGLFARRGIDYLRAAAWPDTPATTANLAGWASGALRLAPYVDTPQADPDEHGSALMVAAQVSGAALQIVLETGQVFRFEAAELTRATGNPAHPFTLNPAGRVLTHASLDGTPLCGQGAEADTASPHWGEVTCLDCQLAAPGTAADALDNLDLMFAERQIRDALTVAAPSPLTAYELMVRADPGVRAAVPGALDRMAGHDAIERADASDGRSGGWRLARPLAG